MSSDQEGREEGLRVADGPAPKSYLRIVDEQAEPDKSHQRGQHVIAVEFIPQ